MVYALMNRVAVDIRCITAVLPAGAFASSVSAYANGICTYHSFNLYSC